jgi:hypothetical protein
VKSTDEKGWSIASTLFDCGRLYIQLRFHLFQAAFLLAGKDHRRRSIAIASRIERLSRRLELTAEAREALEALRETGTEFLEAYTSEWFSDNLITLYDRISERTVFPEDIYEDGEEDRRSTCDLHLAREIEATARLRAALLDGCDRGSRSAFELGELVEQAIHHRDVHRHFFEFHPIDGCRSNGYPGGFFSLDDRAPGDAPPPDGWLRLVRAMLKDLGLGEGTPGILPLRLPASVEARRKAVGVIIRSIRDWLSGADGKELSASEAPAGGGPPGPGIETQGAAYPGTKAAEVEGVATDLESESAEPKGGPLGPALRWTEPGYLGIQIQENGRKLRRVGRPEVHFLKKWLWWNLVLAFLDAGERYLTHDEQIKVWRNHGREEHIEDEARTTAFSKLNVHLRPLGVKIVDDSGDGRRRLESISPT